MSQVLPPPRPVDVPSPMSSGIDLVSRENGPDLLQPRARKPANGVHHPDLLKSEGSAASANTSGSSRSSTPIPSDAPLSVKATSSARKQVRAREKERLFPTIKYAARVSHFDPDSEYRDFRGFFVLFWIGLAIMVITTMLRNMRETGYPFLFRQRKLFSANLWEMAFSDFIMTASAFLVVPLHKLYASSAGIFRWSKGGIYIQSAFQTAWLLYWVNWPFIRSWTWTAQVFFTLHLLTLFMKLHSYAFYMGHLSETSRRLGELDKPAKAAPSKRRAAVRYPSSNSRLSNLQGEYIPSPVKEENSVDRLREDLAMELTSPLGNVTYPSNLTYPNFWDFLCCPTLCYELEYPRTSHIRWTEVAIKALAVFGCIFLLTVTSEEFVLPILDESAIRLSGSRGLAEGGLILAETISRMLFPFMVIFLLVFLVIFEYLLGAFAELTCFADRHFYSDWWNSSDWLEFSREWNIPVHHFFRRHVYLASLSVVSRPLATVITFFISALAHELVMGCITKKLRGYGAFAMMLQMPIVMVQRSKFVRDKKLLNNVLFWCSMILGLSMMCALYVLV